MSRIFFISIKPSLDRSLSVTIDQAYQMLGLNTGNLLFTNAVWSQLSYDKVDSGFDFAPAYVNENFDFVVIPAANWLYERFDFNDLAKLIECVNIPVIMIGVGAQAGENNRIPVIPKGSERLLRAVSERSELIGTRGDFSTEVLNHYGIYNAVTIGCPSFFWWVNGVSEVSMDDLNTLMMGGTRYHFSSHDRSISGLSQRSIYQFAYKEMIDINYQSERPEFDLIISDTDAEISQQHLDAACEYYDCDDKQVLLEYFKNHGHVFTNVNEWVATMKKYDFYLGSRIHGVIASLLAGTPACLLTHDSRTKELAEFASIPSFSFADIGRLTTNVVEDIYSSISFVNYHDSINQGRQNYIKFLDSNNLPHVLQR